MKLKDVIRETISEAASGKDMDKLAGFLSRIARGKVSQKGMLAAGFNLRSPIANNESKLAQTLGVYLSVNITEDDVRSALKEVGVKSGSELAAKWNDIAGRSERRDDSVSADKTKGKARF